MPRKIRKHVCFHTLLVEAEIEALQVMVSWNKGEVDDQELKRACEKYEEAVAAYQGSVE